MSLIYLRYPRRWVLTARKEFARPHRYRAITTVRWFATGVQPDIPVRLSDR